MRLRYAVSKYVQPRLTKIHLLMTPLIRDVMSSMSLGSDGCFDRMRTAVLSITVEIGFKPAALIVSPDSRSCEYSYTTCERKSLTNKIDDTVRNTQSASSLYTAANILDRCLQLALAISVDLCLSILSFEIPKVGL